MNNVIIIQLLILLPLSAENGFKEVIVYPTKDEGSLMHWLAISPLLYNVSYLGDSMSADVLEAEGVNETNIRPRAGDRVQGQNWKKMHYTGTTEGPTMCGLFQVAGRGFNYAITSSFAYVYSPEARPDGIFFGSSDDAIKVILNGKKIWTNQIQRSPTYDGDQASAPLKKGWNTMLVVVDQVWGGHLLCARFLEGGEPIKDLEISLDPPAKNAKRHLASKYNAEASDLIRMADASKLELQFSDALKAYDGILKKYPLSDVAPRAAYAKATCYHDPQGTKSLDRPKDAVAALRALLEDYPQDILAEYALLDLAKIQETALASPTKAEATYRSFEQLYPQSSLAAKSLVELARLLATQKKFEDSILTYRKAIKKYPNSVEVMTATLGIAKTWHLGGENAKALKQFQAAKLMAQDWHDNKYGVDVGKQAWLLSLIEESRKAIEEFLQ
jgi:TolA-binding protein